jgi:hypothetical protein
MFNHVRFVFVCLIGVFVVNLAIGTNLVEGADRNRNSSRDNFVKKAKIKVEAGNYSGARNDMRAAITLDPKNEENLYFAALIDYKLGNTSSSISQCDKILKNNRARNYRDKALKLKRLAQDNSDKDTPIGRVLRGSSTTMLYSTAMTNQQQFVDSGYNNVVSRVQQASKRSLSPVMHRDIAQSSAYDVLTGKEAITVKPATTRLAKATPVNSSFDNSWTDTIKDNTDKTNTQDSTGKLTSPAEKNTNEDVTFTDFDIESNDNKNTLTDHMRPVEVEKPTKPVLEANDNSGFGDFGDYKMEETPVKTTIEIPVELPEKTPAKIDSDDDSGFGDFGDDKKEEKPAEPTKVPEKTPVKNDSDAYSGFGDFGDDKKEEKPVKNDSDGDSGFGDFGDYGKEETPAKTAEKTTAKAPAKKAIAPVKKDNDSGMEGFGDFGDESSEEKEKAESKDVASENKANNSGEDADDFSGFDSF